MVHGPPFCPQAQQDIAGSGSERLAYAPLAVLLNACVGPDLRATILTDTTTKMFLGDVVARGAPDAVIAEACPLMSETRCVHPVDAKSNAWPRTDVRTPADDLSTHLPQVVARAARTQQDMVALWGFAPCVMFLLVSGTRAILGCCHPRGAGTGLAALMTPIVTWWSRDSVAEALALFACCASGSFTAFVADIVASKSARTAEPASKRSRGGGGGGSGSGDGGGGGGGGGDTDVTPGGGRVCDGGVSRVWHVGKGGKPSASKVSAEDCDSGGV